MNEALREEEKKLRMLRFIVDLNQAVLMQQRDLTLREAFDILKSTRRAALNLFPGKDEVFELIYTPRFRRIIRDRFVIVGGRSCK
ncbi:MAG: hypothetical protein A2X58_00740 [Nitrospirae bacterium GWC2_56_14]|nr:MAG: hypothetical protein A2X58_00740 [Nitrospirae bacterium GWC2_56_14]